MLFWLQTTTWNENLFQLHATHRGNLVTSVGPGIIQLWRPSTGKLLAHIRGGCGLIHALLVVQLESFCIHHTQTCHLMPNKCTYVDMGYYHQLGPLNKRWHLFLSQILQSGLWMTCIHWSQITCGVLCLSHRSVVHHSLSGYNGRTADICVFQWTCYHSQLLWAHCKLWIN